jgi:hypothetical protein
LQDEAKTDILRVMIEWNKNGKLKKDSPIEELCKKYGCNKDYPTRLMKKCMKKGDVLNHWNMQGRPKKFDDDCSETIKTLIKQNSENHKRSSAKVLKKQLKRVFVSGNVPSESTILKLKRSMR